MSYDAGITTTPGGTLENTIKPASDTAAALQIQQHSGTQSGPLLSFYDAAGTTFLGGVGPNASAVWKGLALNVTPRTTNYTTLGTDYYIPVDATAGAVTVTLKPSTGTPFGSQQRISKVDSSANAVTVQRGGADTINGGTSITLTSQYDTAVLQSDGNGAWNATLPSASALLTSAVILAPGADTRNRIQATGDFIPLSVQQVGGQTKPFFEVLNTGGIVLGFWDVNGYLTARLASNVSGVSEFGDQVVIRPAYVSSANQQFWLDAAQSMAASVGLHVPGVSAGSNFTVATWNGGGWQEAFHVVNHGDMVRPTGAAGNRGLVLQGAASQTASLLGLQGISSTSAVRDQADFTCTWADSTDATRKARTVFNIWDTAAREALRLEASGSAAMLGFFGAAAVVRPASTDDLRQALINLGLYTTGGATPLDLNGGSLKTAGLLVALAAKTANYTLVDADHTVTADATGGAFTVTLPTASGRIGKQFTVKRINSGANAVTLQGNGAETIDGSNTQSLGSQWSSLTVEAATSTTWIIV